MALVVCDQEGCLWKGRCDFEPSHRAAEATTCLWIKTHGKYPWTPREPGKYEMKPLPEMLKKYLYRGSKTGRLIL
jgi:hypothetical protein